jgi:hypothetical protein
MTDAVRTTTLEEMIQRVAFRLGDLVSLNVTKLSTSTSDFIDHENIPIGNESLVRRQLVVSSGSVNRGTVFVIATTDNDAHSISVEPSFTSALIVGTTAYVINKRGQGFVYNEYKRALNMAQDDAYPIARFPVTASTEVFDASTGVLTVPTTIGEVVDIQYQDDEGFWYPIRRSIHSGYEGWETYQVGGQVLINGQSLRDSLDGLTLRVRGEGKPAAFTTYDSTTKLHPEWLTARACYHLALMGISRDVTGQRARQVITFQQEAESRLSLITTRRSPQSQYGRA